MNAGAVKAPQLSFYMLALQFWLLLWLLPTRRATLRQGSLSQARQANQGRDSQMELDISVMAGAKPRDSQLAVELDTSKM